MKKLTDAEIKAEAENLIEQFYKGESRASAFGLGFVTGADWAQKQLLQQTDCSTLRELLEQELNRLTSARDELISVTCIDETDCEIERIKIAMEVIDELQPVA